MSGIIFSKITTPEIDVLKTETVSENSDNANKLVVEISGEIEKPGVYKLALNSRIDDLLTAAGGLTTDADKTWVEKNLNRAGKVVDGQKLYIPNQSDVSSAINSVRGIQAENSSVVGSEQTVERSQGTININATSQSELETLNGIGPVYAQKIIDQRPYSDISELVSRKIISQKIFDKIKDQISVY